MRKRSGILIAILSLTLFIPSCKDDEPVAPAELSFAESTITVKESDGIIEIEIVMDKPVKEDITIEYSLGGTAIDVVSGGIDYEILSDYLEVDIDEGETTGVIEIELNSDLDFEDPETIEIEIESVDSEAVEITNDDDLEITIEQEDGLLILLEWDQAYTNVDMDLFLWAEDNAGTLVFTGLGATQASFASPEFLFLPNVLDDGTYGISCNYYEGTANPMNFSVKYITIVNSDDVSTVTKTASYNLTHINPWFTSNIDPVLVATYEKSGGTYSTFSDIVNPGPYSRVTSGRISDSFKKGTVTNSALPVQLRRIK